MSHPHLCKSRSINLINQDIWSDQHRRLEDEKQAISDITRVEIHNTQYEDRTQQHIVKNIYTVLEEVSMETYDANTAPSHTTQPTDVDIKDQSRVMQAGSQDTKLNTVTISHHQQIIEELVKKNVPDITFYMLVLVNNINSRVRKDRYCKLSNLFINNIIDNDATDFNGNHITDDNVTNVDTILSRGQ